MSDAYELHTKGFDGLAHFVGDLSSKVERAAVQAINKTADSTRTTAARGIREDLNFSADYLSPSAGRLVVKSYATQSRMEARIFAKNRPVSLARFVTDGAVGQRGGVTVQVKKGHSIRLPKAFLMKLKAGGLLDDETFNLGLAVRLKPGERIQNKREAIEIKNGLALLYGPSVGQAFQRALEKGGLLGATEDFMDVEFERLMGLGG